MKLQRCCAHCPGKLTTSRSNETHECCTPKYVSGNLRTSSLRGNTSGYSDVCKCDEKPTICISPKNHRGSCHDKFSLAKKLHAENLSHQPLPDKVNDSIFKNVRRKESCDRTSSGKCRCFEREIRKVNGRYESVLGCKKPETGMDLAICWEAPIDPIYEPPKPTHIDGTEGGVAPSIFALVQHNSNSTTASLRSTKTQNDHENPADLDSNCLEERQIDRKNVESQTCWECLCKDLKRMNVSKEHQVDSKFKYRRCMACEEKSLKKDDPRLIKSAVGLALGIQKPEKNERRNGLAPKMTIPRPKTPFARRTFCIDTLAPPFSIVNGCRDADYPEHWRLMSIYQQSYRNPQKRKTGHRC